MGRGAQLADLLGGCELAWLRERVRRRLASGQPLSATVALREPDEGQIAAVSRLLGRSYRPVKGLRVDLEEVSAVLRRAGLAADVGAAVEALEGPIVDRSAARARQARAWAEVLEGLAAASGMVEWVEEVRRSGVLKRLAGGDPVAGSALAAQLCRVLAALPAEQVSISRFAAEVLGEAHGLDRGRPLAALVGSALRARFGEPALDGAEGWVEQWAAAGVLVGDLTSTVLVAGFGPQPRVWTLRQVARSEVDLSAAVGRTVWVWENPTVLAEAVEAFGPACPPMVCASGQPTVAVLTLLRTLLRVASQVRYHGDFDWDGLRVANRLVAHLGLRPWRFGAADYRAAVAAGAGGVPLSAGPVEAVWDTGLASAMRAAGVAVEEEAVLADLLTELHV